MLIYLFLFCCHSLSYILLFRNFIKKAKVSFQFEDSHDDDVAFNILHPFWNKSFIWEYFERSVSFISDWWKYKKIYINYEYKTSSVFLLVATVPFSESFTVIAANHFMKYSPLMCELFLFLCWNHMWMWSRFINFPHYQFVRQAHM